MVVAGAWIESIFKVVSLVSSFKDVADTRTEASKEWPRKRRIQGLFPFLVQSMGVYFSIVDRLKEGSDKGGREVRGLDLEDLWSWNGKT